MAQVTMAAKGNPANPDGYPTDYLWKNVFQADSMMDIVQKFISLQEINGSYSQISPNGRCAQVDQRR